MQAELPANDAPTKLTGAARVLVNALASSKSARPRIWSSRPKRKKISFVAAAVGANAHDSRRTWPHTLSQTLVGASHRPGGG